MEEYFDNSELLNNIGPNVDRIAQLRFQRNLALGVCLVFGAFIGIAYFFKIQEEKKKSFNTTKRC